MTTRPLRIYHICYRPLTGVWTVMRTLADWQRDHMAMDSHLVVIADRAWPHRDELTRSGLPFDLIETSAPSGGAGLLYLELTRVRRRIADVVQVPALTHYHNAWMSGAIIAGCDETPSVVTFHGLPYPGYFDGHPARAALHRHLAKRTLKSEAKLVSVDSDAPRRAPSLLGIPAEKFSVVPNGANDTSQRGCPRLAGEGVVTVGVLGTLDENKGWRITARAVTSLARCGSKVRLLVAGPGDPEAEADATSLCHDVGNGSRYFGVVARPREDFIPLIDVLVVASRTEGLPMSVLECLAAGVPVIATRVGGLAEILEHGRNALFVDRDANEIAAAVQNLISHPPLHARLSRNARSAYERKGSVAQMAEKYKEIYQSIAPTAFELWRGQAFASSELESR